MTPEQIARLLQPFLAESLNDSQFEQLCAYLELLLKWNLKMNLTSVRRPEEIITRHFGESLFAAAQLGKTYPSLIDIGSGAGFPGVPIKIFHPGAHVTLTESRNKKATFLKEVIRALKLENTRVRSARAEDIAETAAVVTMRAVERFDEVLQTAAKKLLHGGRLCLLIGAAQFEVAQQLRQFVWTQHPIPHSESRIVAIGEL